MPASLATMDSLDQYVSQINRHKLLTKSQEQELAFEFLKTGATELAHRMVVSNLRFVVKVAHEYKGYNLKILDLIQEGNIGLMMAVKKFDPEKGYRLISYAVWWIRAYIQNYIIRSWSLVKMGTTQAQRKLFFKMRSEREKAKR
ncbi:sigma-70 family RNA polymerase sigma factor, partial [Myxococcota bacterium]|nr:sigma-70 family RNA polymerase sigma factor [Myxococcota bacterium]